jgi:hypothetical protein
MKMARSFSILMVCTTLLALGYPADCGGTEPDLPTVDVDEQCPPNAPTCLSIAANLYVRDLVDHPMVIAADIKENQTGTVLFLVRGNLGNQPKRDYVLRVHWAEYEHYFCNDFYLPAVGWSAEEAQILTRQGKFTFATNNMSLGSTNTVIVFDPRSGGKERRFAPDWDLTAVPYPTTDGRVHWKYKSQCLALDDPAGFASVDPVHCTDRRLIPATPAQIEYAKGTG